MPDWHPRMLSTIITCNLTRNPFLTVVVARLVGWIVYGPVWRQIMDGLILSHNTMFAAHFPPADQRWWKYLRRSSESKQWYVRIPPITLMMVTAAIRPVQVKRMLKLLTQKNKLEERVVMITPKAVKFKARFCICTRNLG